MAIDWLNAFINATVTAAVTTTTTPPTAPTRTASPTANPTPRTPDASGRGDGSGGSGENDSSLGTGAIVGLVVAFAVVCLLAVGLVKRRRDAGGPKRTTPGSNEMPNPVYATPDALRTASPGSPGAPAQPWEAYAQLSPRGTSCTDTDATLRRGGGGKSRASGKSPGEHVYTALGVAETRVNDKLSVYNKLGTAAKMEAAGVAPGAAPVHASFGFSQDESKAARPASALYAVFDGGTAAGHDSDPDPGGGSYAPVAAHDAYEELADDGGTYSNPAELDATADAPALPSTPSRLTKPPSFLTEPDPDGQFNYTAMSGPGGGTAGTAEPEYAVPAEIESEMKASSMYQSGDRYAAPRSSSYGTPQDRAEADLRGLKAERRRANDADDEVEVARLSTLIQAIMATRFVVPDTAAAATAAGDGDGGCDMPVERIYSDGDGEAYRQVRFDGNGADYDYGALPSDGDGDGDGDYATSPAERKDSYYAALAGPGPGQGPGPESSASPQTDAFGGPYATLLGASAARLGPDDVYASLGAPAVAAAAATSAGTALAGEDAGPEYTEMVGPRWSVNPAFNELDAENQLRGDGPAALHRAGSGSPSDPMTAEMSHHNRYASPSVAVAVAPVYKGVESETQLKRLSAADRAQPDYALPIPKDGPSDPTYACVAPIHHPGAPRPDGIHPGPAGPSDESCMSAGPRDGHAAAALVRPSMPTRPPPLPGHGDGDGDGPMYEAIKPGTDRTDLGPCSSGHPDGDGGPYADFGLADNAAAPDLAAVGPLYDTNDVAPELAAGGSGLGVTLGAGPHPAAPAAAAAAWDPAYDNNDAMPLAPEYAAPPGYAT